MKCIASFYLSAATYLLVAVGWSPGIAAQMRLNNAVKLGESATRLFLLITITIMGALHLRLVPIAQEMLQLATGQQDGLVWTSKLRRFENCTDRVAAGCCGWEGSAVRRVGRCEAALLAADCQITRVFTIAIKLKIRVTL